MLQVYYALNCPFRAPKGERIVSKFASCTCATVTCVVVRILSRNRVFSYTYGGKYKQIEMRCCYEVQLIVINTH
jgi:hypothetical protein